MNVDPFLDTFSQKTAFTWLWNTYWCALGQSEFFSSMFSLIEHLFGFLHVSLGNWYFWAIAPWEQLTSQYNKSGFIQQTITEGATEWFYHSIDNSSYTAALMIGPSKSSLHQLSPLNHKYLFLCYFPVKHIFVPCWRISANLPRGALQADSVMPFVSPLFDIALSADHSRLSQWNCQVMKKFHSGTFPLWSLSYLSAKQNAFHPFFHSCARI